MVSIEWLFLSVLVSLPLLAYFALSLILGG